LQSPFIESSAGSVSQIRECAAEFQQFAKETGIPVFLIGHITKEGSIAGPKCWSIWWIPCCSLKATGIMRTAFCVR
jgi:predicted ATP-dependent serine protease